MFRVMLADKPFHDDARVDDIRCHAAWSRSRSRRTVSVLSMSERSRPRRALARSEKLSVLDDSAARRISRCSASAERPCARARRFSAAMISALTLRTVNWGIGASSWQYACNACIKEDLVQSAQCTWCTRLNRMRPDSGGHVTCFSSEEISGISTRSSGSLPVSNSTARSAASWNGSSTMSAPEVSSSSVSGL